jgi:PIN domain nuclease of toxin-antitoxin system
MKYLVDTHILLWSFFEPEHLSNSARNILQDEGNEIYYSPISLLEISIKYSLKKLRLGDITPEEFFIALQRSFFRPKPVDAHTALTLFRLPIRHKDPFDRFLVWEAITSQIILLTSDAIMADYESDGLVIAR